VGFGLVGVSFAVSPFHGICPRDWSSSNIAIGWGIWAAPKSPRRLKGKNLFIFKTAAYTMATFALLESDQVRTSILFGFLGAVNLYLNFISRNQGY
jgi:hypothetical protein